MKNDNPLPYTVGQLEEALEERQRPDRRKQEQDSDNAEEAERRKQDRRQVNEH